MSAFLQLARADVVLERRQLSNALIVRHQVWIYISQLISQGYLLQAHNLQEIEQGCIGNCEGVSDRIGSLAFLDKGIQI